MSCEIECVRGAISAAEAEARIRSVAAGYEVRARVDLYYPYHWFELRMPRALSFCLVDARSGAAGTADRFELERREVVERSILAPRIAAERAGQMAMRFARARLLRRRELVLRGLVHRPFWMVSCRHEREETFSAIVDGVTGAFCPLPDPPRSFA